MTTLATTPTKNAIISINGKSGEYTGFSFTTMCHHFSMYDGSTVKLTELDAIKAVGIDTLYPKTKPTPKFWVTMTDKFMSGWGGAAGKINKLIIACYTYEQAEIIERNANRRNEMKYVNICSRKPRYGNNVIESWKTWDDMGEIWKK